MTLRYSGVLLCVIDILHVYYEIPNYQGSASEFRRPPVVAQLPADNRSNKVLYFICLLIQNSIFSSHANLYYFLGLLLKEGIIF